MPSAPIETKKCISFAPLHLCVFALKYFHIGQRGWHVAEGETCIMAVDAETVREILRSELPRVVSEDPALRRALWLAVRNDFADKAETESRFDQVLAEIKREREEQSRKWDDQTHQWDEQNRKWDEQNHKWDENQRVINQVLEEIRALNRKHESSIGALGARWGMQSEESFRNALRGILEGSFGVQVININEWDDSGEVFGRPDQIEMDLIVLNGLLILCEIKSSMSKGDMVIFERKTRWYEKRHNRQADRRMVISPMVDRRALKSAHELGIEVYSYAEDVER